MNHINQKTTNNRHDLEDDFNLSQIPAEPTKQPGLVDLFGLQKDVNLVDGRARFEAINPFESFIVQAPAGSGKTALLTQRFLALLSQVEQPEQIVAMTFTKKAASEMRDRVMGALKFGQTTLGEEVSLNDQNTWNLAQAALKQDADQGWKLLQNPNRLRIKTIDGLNSYLVGQMPLLSKMGAQSQISNDVDAAYKEAVHLALKTPQLADAVGRLLGLVNGRFNRAENLLVTMLKKRDQWMGSLLGLGGDEARTDLEASLDIIVRDELKQQVAILSHVKPLLAEACELAMYAVQNDQPELEGLCGAWPLTDSIESLKAWHILSAWLLRKDSKGVRKTVTKNNGFPAGKGLAKDRKDQFLNILAGLREGGHPQAVLEALAILKELPEPKYTEDQWLDLQWLIQLLTVCAAYLKVVFQSSGQADFIEVAQAASQALGEPLEPTDLAQQLDYQVKHLLVDEFQDTSSEQFKLIKKLIASWQIGDGRTLFIVGDPMQSIYRFREAEVGNFLKVWTQSDREMGELVLKPLTLQVNFRSTQGVVDWVNQHFKQVLPKENTIEKGAVAYRDSSAYSTDKTPAVTTHWALNQAPEKEASEILNVIQQRLSEFTDGDGKSIALLGRTRSSLMPIAHLLKASGIPFRAVDLESLKDRQEIHDLLALSRALLHLSDRAAWIALLRSPLVGLSLNDLYAIMGPWPYQSVWGCLTLSTEVLNGEIDKQDELFSLALLMEAWAQKGLSEEGCSRLFTVMPILQNTLSRIGSLPFSTLVREAWIQLDGPQTLENSLALENIEVFCHTLAELDGESIDFEQLENLIDALYARADSSSESARLELMTMHKSKGLEFDTVILPGLGRKPRNDDVGLVSWFQFVAGDGGLTGGTAGEVASERLVIAPITQFGQPISRLTQLLKRFENEKQSYELGRLLYVAATRAKQKLHLFGQIKAKESESIEDVLSPTKDSMLAALWPAIENDFIALSARHEFVEDDSVEKNPPWPKISRLPLNRTGFSALFASEETDVSDENSVKSLGGGSPKKAIITKDAECNERAVERHDLVNVEVGNLVHAVLEQFVDEGRHRWTVETVKSRIPFYELALLQSGLHADEVPNALERVVRSLCHAVNNEQVRWALGSDFSVSQSEQSLSSVDDKGDVKEHIVDRTFVDDSDTRWIIDYKTSQCDGADVEGFIEKKTQLYREQLERYGNLFLAMESRPQKWVLYFSDMDRWVELN